MDSISAETTSPKSALQRDARGPLIKRMVELLISQEERVTLIAVCPNSEVVARAALLAAKEANAPLLYAATLNQVDTDGGYTGWTPQQLVRFLDEEAGRIGVPGPVLACLDHGGPWLKDRHTIESYGYEEAMQAVKHSLEACLDAGYALLHIDPTVDRRLPPDEPVPVQKVVARTLELIEHAERYRRAQELAPVSYEVGTEEVKGGLARLESFEFFLQKLDEGLKARGLEAAWPCFVVGKVGTDLGTTHFDAEMARTLTARTRPYGALVKGHYTDQVENPEAYPLSGMGGANVGPELTEVEYEALMDLVALERQIGKDSGLEAALREAVHASGRWTKWLRKGEKGHSFEALPHDRQQWLVRTGSRYIWNQPAVREARRQLYENLEGYRQAERYVLWRVKEAIMKYYHAFNLIDFNERLGQALPQAYA